MMHLPEPEPSRDDEALAATLACIRLLGLHEQVELEYDAFKHMERQLEAALRDLDMPRLQMLEAEAREGKIRVGKLLRALAFAATEYRILDDSVLKSDDFGTSCCDGESAREEA